MCLDQPIDQCFSTFFVAAHFQRFQNLAAHIQKDKFRNYLLTYNTLRRIVYGNNNFKYAK